MKTHFRCLMYFSFYKHSMGPMSFRLAKKDSQLVASPTE